MVLWGLSCITVLFVPCVNFYIFILMLMCIFMLSSVAQVSAFLCSCQPINTSCFLRMFISPFHLWEVLLINPIPPQSQRCYSCSSLTHPVQEITGNFHSCPPSCKGYPGGLSSGVFALRKCDSGEPNPIQDMSVAAFLEQQNKKFSFAWLLSFGCGTSLGVTACAAWELG